MDPADLHLLLDEEIYLIQEETSAEQIESSLPQQEEAARPAVDAPQEEEDVPTAKAGAEDTPVEAPLPPQPEAATSAQDAEQAKASDPIIPVAIFHETTSQADLALLDKIISACKLDHGTFQIMANGFSKEVTFQKALVFVEKSKAFYEPIPYRDGQILCSRPLHQIAVDQGEKAKLWGALQQFL